MRLAALAVIIIVVGVTGCVSSSARSAKPHHAARGARGNSIDRTGTQTGLASWYGGKHAGGPTASGERMDPRKLTAAHRTLKMNTRVRVTNRRNGKTVIVRINDRGPYGRGRIIDLSRAAAIVIDMIDDGVVPVRLDVLP